ncbi:hypothetical protein [Methylobacterium organophilum]|uniref:Uncharacterized protein n=1 Tax=Methylobacterium organophilum TaxID=410 RepID=A0ABQ4T5B5_METOR|nr:hypothetical protein [Methylobacterium organophilum]GJE26216.1 hypothetical protein LKMONMHP_1063 [Methylobacterium organophilum]
MNASVERVRDALADLVRAALVSDDGRSLAFRQAAAERIVALAADPPAVDSMRIDGAWMLAVKAAESPVLRPEEGQVSLTLPEACPIPLAALTGPGFDVDAAVEQIRKAAATG